MGLAVMAPFRSAVTMVAIGKFASSSRSFSSAEVPVSDSLGSMAMLRAIARCSPRRPAGGAAKRRCPSEAEPLVDARSSEASLNLPAVGQQMWRTHGPPFLVFQFDLDFLQPGAKRRLAVEGFLGGGAVSTPPDDLVSLGVFRVAGLEPERALTLFFEDVNHVLIFCRISQRSDGAVARCVNATIYSKVSPTAR